MQNLYSLVVKQKTAQNTCSLKDNYYDKKICLHQNAACASYVSNTRALDKRSI